MKEMIIDYTQQAFPFFLAAAVAFAISCILTPAAIRIAPKIGAMDIPKDNRRMHKKAMPRFGGMAIFAGTEISLAIFCHSDPKVITILIGGILIYAVGVADDLKGIPAKLKFLLQMLCAAVLYAGGIRVDFVKNPLGIFMDGGPEYIHFPLVISLIITVIWIVGITNTVNLIDGLDGLAAGVAVIASGYISYAAVLSGQYGVALAMIAVTGGALGFLPFNFHPAKIFMGDSGSLYLGFMIAAISVLGSTKGATLIVTIVPFLALGLPIFDTMFAIIRRISHGQNPMAPDRSHVHHRLIDMGLNQKQAVAVLYVISAILGLSAVVLATSGEIKAILCLMALIIVCLIAVRVIFLPHMSDEEKKHFKEHSLRQELTEIEEEVREDAASRREPPSGAQPAEDEETLAGEGSDTDGSETSGRA